MNTLTAKKLIVEATENNESIYEFGVWEFSNGLILVPGETTHDWLFTDREEIQPCGLDYVSGIKETEETADWTRLELAKALGKSTVEFSWDLSIQKGWELIKATR